MVQRSVPRRGRRAHRDLASSMGLGDLRMCQRGGELEVGEAHQMLDYIDLSRQKHGQKLGESTIIIEMI